MKKKILLMLIIITLGILAFGAGTASAATEGYFTYTISNGKATITDCAESASGEITVPATLGGYPVTKIGDNAFSYCYSLTGVSIPNGVTDIGFRAFCCCESLTDIRIPDSVTAIGAEAFYECKSLTSVSIPDSVTDIGNLAFWCCYSLRGVSIPDSVTAIGDETFSHCESLTSVSIGDGVTKIGTLAFGYCESLTSITIPDSVTSIGEKAFECCYSLADIIIGDSVTVIGYGAFSDCESLTSVSIPGSMAKIDKNAFWNCDNLSDVYYKGSQEEWNNINIGSFNTNLKRATKHYISHTRTAVSANGKSFTITPVNMENGKTVILALYNGEKLVDIQKATYAGTGIPFKTSASYSNAKVMVWNNLTGLIPVCDEEIVK